MLSDFNITGFITDATSESISQQNVSRKTGFDRSNNRNHGINRSSLAWVQCQG